MMDTVAYFVRGSWSRARSKRGVLIALLDHLQCQHRPALRVFFTDRASIPPPGPESIRRIDFVGECRKVYDGPPPPKADLDPDKPGFANEMFRKMKSEALRLNDDSDLVNAAWLYKLGEKELAAKAMKFVPADRKAEIARVRKDLAWSAYAALTHAYMVRADDEALSHGKRLLNMARGFAATPREGT